MMIPILLLAVGFVLLIKGGDWFVDGATGIARRFRLSEMLIGATVVSIGTTLPEVMVSAGAAFRGSGSIAYGNAIGSIICNASLIAALTIAISPGPAARRSMILPVVFFFGSAALYCGVAYFTGTFSRMIGILLLCIFLAYMVSTVLRMKSTVVSAEIVASEEAKSFAVKEGSEEHGGKGHTAESAKEGTKDSLLNYIILLVLGAVLIAVGADILVDNAIIIAEKCGVSEKVIGLTIVALGTSLPELVTAITALIKGHSSLSLGNIIGANIFNLVLVSGMAITISPFDIPVAGTIGGINSSLVLDIPVMLTVMAILTLPTLFRRKLSRWQGILLLGIYVVFCILQFVI